MATVLQTALRTAGGKLEMATVSFSTTLQKFVLTIPQNSGDIKGYFTGADADALGLSSGTIKNSAAAETILEILSTLSDNDIDFDFITVEQDLQESQTAFDIASWATTQENKKFLLEFYDAASTTVGDVTSPLYRMYQSENENVVLLFDKEATRDYKSIGLASEYASVNYFGIDTLPDGKWIVLRGFQTTKLSEEEARELRL